MSSKERCYFLHILKNYIVINIHYLFITYLVLIGTGYFKRFEYSSILFYFRIQIAEEINSTPALALGVFCFILMVFLAKQHSLGRCTRVDTQRRRLGASVPPNESICTYMYTLSIVQ